MANVENENKIENGLFEILKPAVKAIDDQVEFVKQSQVELQGVIDSVTQELQRIGEAQPANIDFDPYIKRLINTKRRVVLVSNIIQNVQDRLTKLHKSAEGEVLRKQALVEANNALLSISRIQSDNDQTTSGLN